MWSKAVLSVLFCGLFCTGVKAHIPEALERYTPKHLEVIDILPNDFGPTMVNPLEPTAPEDIPPQTFRGPVSLGNSIEQLLREPARFGSLEFYVKQKMQTYLHRFHRAVGQNTVIFQLDA
ncbi:conserved hypothetical protein [Neospora caninum Liverpool]|uniref:Uncharacterized protein n=1 Tax=Neospora caninum (strain Liverpool) TaxID=572307 RepID=F0VK43_NEOCL|nr:conserved hypothetical protein [Neospora caninum Liverpool]CBZ54444.1 conserved hypothetical protein [Neospora caninum Liverpool]CEL69154.1 TPA: hypothetical protein BN1204_048730 [Neospora caninum Liverpool]|eukprot:XP_003884474.1 conserved hypothetical protein [Neospora caninum Liverpool]